MENETKQATRLLQAQRVQDRDEQAFGWIRNRFSSQAGTEFTYREINKVLAEVVESNGSLGVVKALLALGADVNFVRRRNSNTWNKFTQRNHQGERSNLLLRATIRCRPETVDAIAAHADQENLDSVLHHAIVRGNLAVLRALLNHGASPVQLHDDFQNVVFNDQVELIKVLLSGHHLPCLACRSTSLRIAVENRSLEVLRLLLDHWADVNYGDAIALIRAVELSRPDILTILLSGTVRPSPRSLDAAVGKVQDLIAEKDSSVNCQLLELCLEAGSTGPETTRLITQGVLQAVKRGHIRLLDTILRYKRLPSQHEAVALTEAVRTEQLDVVAKLLEFRPCPTSLTLAVSQALSVSDRLRYETVKLLIAAGAQGACVAEALVKATHCLVASLKRGDKKNIERDNGIFRLILREGKADVDFGNGEALQIAVRASCLDIAKEIVSKEPSPDSLGAALSWAMEIPNAQTKRALIELLLRREVNQDAAGKALVGVLKGDPGNTALVELLLTRSSVNYNNGEAFIYAVRNFRAETFHLLLSQGIGYKALFTTLLEALKVPRPDRRLLLSELINRLQLDHLNTALKHVVLEENADLPLVKMLLDSGAEPMHEDGVCIKHSASKLDYELLSLLSEASGPNEGIYTQAFAAIINRGKKWIAFEHAEVVGIVVRYGASRQISSRAMVDIIDHLVCQPSQEDLAKALLDKLFAAGVDVNHENGKAVSIAASRGDPRLLAYLLANGATSSTTTLALTAAIMAHHDESALLQLIDIFDKQQSGVPDFNKSIPGMPPPILLCLKSYGTSVPILDRLVKAGCHLEGTIPMQICSPKVVEKEGEVIDPGLEPASVLMWALLQEADFISVEVLTALLGHGADFSYTTPRSRTTPLLLAVRSGRTDVAKILLEAGARVSAKDAFGHSALFYASRAGNVELVALLLKSKPIVNDGSLHEASRGFHVQTMKLLLDAGHDPNYRSSKHGGRTALGEMALKAVVPQDAAMAEEAIDLLSAVDASPLLKVHGKTVIFLALDNRNNETITRLLLDRMLYKTLNSHENTYQQGIYHYSPTMYVSKGILLGPHPESLLQLLQAHGAEDRFYATMEETQPPDAAGLPEEIREFERERRARERQKRLQEEEHAATLRREREKAQTYLQLRDEEHSMTLWQSDELSQQQRRHRGLDHQQSLQLKAEAHHVNAEIRTSEANLHSSIRWQRHADDLAMLAQKREADAAHRHQAHLQGLDERRDKARVADETRELRHARSLAHMRDVQRQKWAEKEERNRQQLEFENLRMVQEYEYRWKKRHQLERERMQEKERMLAERDGRKRAGVKEKHEMKMTELRTQRGNIIGQVNLDELRRWQASQGQGKDLSQGMGLTQGMGNRVKLLTT